MAEMHIKYDTVTKACTATMGGKAIADFHGVEMYRSYGEKKGEDPKYCMSVLTASADEEHDYRTMTRLTASEDGTLADKTPLRDRIAARLFS